MLSLTLIPSAFASDTSNSTCPLGKAFKVAVFQAGSYGDFQKVFRQTTIALQKKDLIKGPLLDPTFTHDKEGVYERFSKDSQGGCIEFVSDGFYNGLWNSEYTQDLANRLWWRIKVRTKARVRTLRTVDITGANQVLNKELEIAAWKIWNWPIEDTAGKALKGACRWCLRKSINHASTLANGLAHIDIDRDAGAQL